MPRIDPNSFEIRLLTISPGNESEPIVCTLTCVSLNEEPIYEALSYVWGDPGHRRWILINDRKTEVTVNAEIAIRHLRLRNRPRTVWLDATCINQADMEERKHQVQLMGLIYSTAARVLIWLGQAEKGANFTMDCLKSLAAGESLDAHTLSIVKVYFQALFGRSWSTRVWVVQELAKAQRDPLIGCGHIWLPWSTFIQGYTALRHSTASSILSPDNAQSLGRALPIPASVPDNQMQSFDNLNQIREHYIAKGGLPLQHVLYLTMDLKATDPRDKIYAVLGLLDKHDKGLIQPDYRKPVQKVYTEAMAALLRRAGSLQPACLFAFSRPDSKQMPSWVPDFSNQKRDSPDNPLAFYDGADNAPGQRGSYISMTKDTAPLWTDGLYVDRIDNVVPTGIQDESMKHYDEYNLPLSEIEQVALDKISSVAKAAGLRGLGESEPLWRILIANRTSATPDETRNPICYDHMYEVLRGRTQVPYNFAKALDHSMDPVHEYTGPYRHILAAVLLGRSFFTTQNGLMGIGLPGVTKGDVVAVLFGAKLPFILRPYRNMYRMIGASYVSGITSGKMADKALRSGRLFPTKFVMC